LAHQAHDGATRHLAIGLPWAARIEGEQQRMEVEAQLLTLSGMVLVLTDQVDRARETLTAVLSRGEALGKQRLQLGAMENLAVLESDLGRWPEAVAWAERGHQLALSIGARAMVTGALMNLAIAAEAQGDVATALGLDGEALQVNREIGDRRLEAVSLRRLGKMHLDGGDAGQALQHFAQAQALHQALDDVLEASALEASVGLCALRQGQADAALAAVNTQLGRLQGDLAQVRAAETIELRWLCAQVLDALGDDRVDTLLAQLSSDLRARALALGGQADCERLIQSRPLYRDIEAAHARRARPA
jgi:tetratricopeptide (TPR) repeat protein